MAQEIATADIQNFIKDLLLKTQLKNVTYNTSAGSVTGDNYLGIITALTVTGTDEKGNEKTLNFIIKTAPTNENMRSFYPIPALYEREIYMYSEVFPEFLKLQKEKHLLNHFTSLPKCYATNSLEFSEYLVMKNMKSLGYSLHDRKTPLDFEHTLLTLKEYGRYHALSFALRDQKPELFKKLAENTQDKFMESFARRSRKYVDDSLQKAIEGLHPVQHKIGYEQFNTFRKDPFKVILEITKEQAAGPYAVFGHGDSWMNNVLYKYGHPDTPNTPTELCFLDFQLSRCGSPALDISYFIFACTDKKLRNKNYENFIHEYYKSFSSFLRELGSDPEIMFPFAVLQQHLKKFSACGLFVSVFVLHLMTSESEEIPDINTTNVNENVGEKLSFSSQNLDKFHERFRDALLDFIKYGYEL